VAWPWYCAIGALTNVSVSIIASILIDGFQKEYSPYSVKGQIAKFKAEGLTEKDGGWYLVPGKVDPIAWWLIVFFGATVLFLALFDLMIPGAT
jgi:SSS family solute:Na+ symporter